MRFSIPILAMCLMILACTTDSEAHQADMMTDLTHVPEPATHDAKNARLADSDAPQTIGVPQSTTERALIGTIVHYWGAHPAPTDEIALNHPKPLLIQRVDEELGVTYLHGRVMGDEEIYYDFTVGDPYDRWPDDGDWKWTHLMPPAELRLTPAPGHATLP